MCVCACVYVYDMVYVGKCVYACMHICVACLHVHMLRLCVYVFGVYMCMGACT